MNVPSFQQPRRPQRRSLPFRTLRRLGVLALAVAVGACSGGDAGLDWQGSVVDSAGIRVVHNPDRGIWGEEDAWRVTEELRLGTLEGAPELQFGSITAMDVDAEGTIYVADSQAREVRVFAADGTYLRTLGAPGSGPGELGQGLGALFVEDDGSVQVVDMMNQRVSTYAPDGSPAGGFPLDFTGGIPIRWAQLPSGGLLAQLRGMGIPGMAAHEGGDLLAVYSDEGAVVDTLHTLPRGRMMEMSAGGPPRITLFETEPIWALGQDGTLATAVNTDYRVEVRGPEAELRHVFTMSWEPRPVEEPDKRAFRRLLRETMEDQGTPPQAVEAMMGNISFAEHYPAFGNLLAGPFESVWVQQITTASDIRGAEDVEIDPQDLGSPEWDVFDREGRFMGTLTLPRHFTPLKIRDDAVYGVWEDDLDVQHVMRLKVEPPAT